MRTPASRYSLLLLTSLLSGWTAAQELTLFEQVETAPAEQPQAAPQFMMNQNGQPAFTVRGTVRVGDLYRVSLVNREGVVKMLEWRAGERVTVPGADGYAVLDVQPRSVLLLQPQGDPCMEAPALGVSCNASGQSLLTLSTAAVLPPTMNQPAPTATAGVTGPAMGPQNPFEAAIQAQQAQQAAAGPAVFIGPNGQQVVVDPNSPEMQAARDARQRARADRLGQFQPARIPDDQIPPGMRRVSTPFGDRLIPERE
jgi:hypothetical protein